jgi:hypothetical protein
MLIAMSNQMIRLPSHSICVDPSGSVLEETKKMRAASRVDENSVGVFICINSS